MIFRAEIVYLFADFASGARRKNTSNMMISLSRAVPRQNARSNLLPRWPDEKSTPLRARP
jgi:hypothetical protein